MHDWTRVQAGIWHPVHGRWLYAIQDALNDGRLPPDHYALAEQLTRQVGPDVLTFQVPSPHRTPPTRSSGSSAPSTQLLERVKRANGRKAVQRRLSIRHIEDHRMVAVIEIVSPSNKGSRSAFHTFVQKAVGLIDAGVHLLIIDPFPPTPRDPDGIHAAVWRQFRETAGPRPPHQPLTLAAYHAEDEVTAYVEPFAVGDALRDMPLFVDAEQFVTVPLEETYQVAWASVPEVWRAVVRGPAGEPAT